jgi:Trypsin-co-occurring domain 2
MMDQGAPSDGNELSQVLAGLRANLETAQKAGENHEIRFLMDEIEVELNVATTGETKAEGGIKFWVLNFGGETKANDQQTQKVKLKMKVVDRGGRPLLVSRRDTK